MVKRLNCIKVETPHHVELMRCIYNENIDRLATHPIPKRIYEEQQAWWNEAKKYSDAYLYEPKDKPGKYIAFLLLRKRAGFRTPVVAIQKEEQGNHYGQEIIRDYIRKSDGPIAGEQLRSNIAICHINKKVGWQIIGERKEGDDVTELLFHPGINPEKSCTREVFVHILEYLNMEPDSFDFEKLNKPYLAEE